LFNIYAPVVYALDYHLNKFNIPPVSSSDLSKAQKRLSKKINRYFKGISGLERYSLKMEHILDNSCSVIYDSAKSGRTIDAHLLKKAKIDSETRREMYLLFLKAFEKVVDDVISCSNSFDELRPYFVQFFQMLSKYRISCVFSESFAGNNDTVWFEINLSHNTFLNFILNQSYESRNTVLHEILHSTALNNKLFHQHNIFHSQYISEKNLQNAKVTNSRKRMANYCPQSRINHWSRKTYSEKLNSSLKEKIYTNLPVKSVFNDRVYLISNLCTDRNNDKSPHQLNFKVNYQRYLEACPERSCEFVMSEEQESSTLRKIPIIGPIIDVALESFSPNKTLDYKGLTSKQATSFCKKLHKEANSLEIGQYRGKINKLEKNAQARVLNKKYFELIPLHSEKDILSFNSNANLVYPQKKIDFTPPFYKAKLGEDFIHLYQVDSKLKNIIESLNTQKTISTTAIDLLEWKKVDISDSSIRGHLISQFILKRFQSIGLNLIENDNEWRIAKNPFLFFYLLQERKQKWKLSTNGPVFLPSVLQIPPYTFSFLQIEDSTISLREILYHLDRYRHLFNVDMMIKKSLLDLIEINIADGIRQFYYYFINENYDDVVVGFSKEYEFIKELKSLGFVKYFEEDLSKFLKIKPQDTFNQFLNSEGWGKELNVISHTARSERHKIIEDKHLLSKVNFNFIYFTKNYLSRAMEKNIYSIDGKETIKFTEQKEREIRYFMKRIVD